MLRKQLEKREEGFTLIELLVVVIIIGILAAIAIPVFLNQRTKAWDAAAKSDVKNMATAQETYLTDTNSYTSTITDLTARGFTKSASVLHCAAHNAGLNYTVAAKHTNSAKTWYFDSTSGKLTETAPASPALTCTPAA